MMKRVKLLVFILIIPFSIVLAGNREKENKGKEVNSTFTVNGVVVDKATGEALTGVKVQLSGTNNIAYTDFDGNFEFGSLKSADYKIETSLISYQNNTEEVKCNAGANKVQIELEIVK